VDDRAARVIGAGARAPAGLTVKTVREALGEESSPVWAGELARSFKWARRAQAPELLETMAELGGARMMEDGPYTG
jgi:hypothetical protein